MLITIITVCFNSEKTIGRTIESVLSQNYQRWELRIVDGASTDNTINIAQKYCDPRIIITTEPDLGIYDAMNKGLVCARGDVVGFLNSDDAFYDSTVLEKISQALNRDDIDGCYGNLVYFEPDSNRITRFWKAGKYSEKKINRGWMPPHPTLYLKRHVYEDVGLFDLSFGTACDYQYFLRIAVQKMFYLHNIDETLIRMQDFGASGKNLFARLKASVNDYRSWKSVMPTSNFFLSIKKPLMKIGQLFNLE